MAKSQNEEFPVKSIFNNDTHVRKKRELNVIK